jgi:hypothetical protein
MVSNESGSCTLCRYEYSVEPLTDHEDFEGPVCTGCLRSWQFGHVPPIRGKHFEGLSERGKEKITTTHDGYEYNGSADRRAMIREEFGV